MSKADYALLTKFNSIANLMFGVFSSGIGIAFVRSVSEMSGAGNIVIAKRLYVLTLMLAILVLLPVFILSPVLSGLYKVSTSLIVVSLTYALVISSIKITQYYYQGQELYNKGGWIDVFRTIGILLPLVIIAIVYEMTIKTVCLVFIVSGGILFLFFFGNIVKLSALKIDQETIQNGKNLLKECGWLLLYRFILELFCQMDVFMLSRYASDTDVADYGVAQKYQALALSVLPALLALMRVKSAKREYAQSAKKRKEFTTKWIRLTAPWIIVFTIIGIIVSPFVFPLLNGAKYNDSIPLFQIMLVGIGISYIFSPNTPILMSAKRFPTLCLLCLGSLLISVIGNYFFIPLYGAISPAVFFVLSHAFLNVGSTLCVIRDTHANAEADD